MERIRESRVFTGELRLIMLTADERADQVGTEA